VKTSPSFSTNGVMLSEKLYKHLAHLCEEFKYGNSTLISLVVTLLSRQCHSGKNVCAPLHPDESSIDYASSVFIMVDYVNFENEKLKPLIAQPPVVCYSARIC
jgi:hypothetical protein